LQLLLTLQLCKKKEIEKEMKTFRDLLVWQKSMSFVTEVSSTFPKEEVFGLTSQIRRCSVSVPSNISEGFGREGVKDYLRFLNIAIASLFELQTQLEIAYNLYELSREIERMLSSFIRSIKLKLSQLCNNF
jgi:four helix bundle protein